MHPVAIKRFDSPTNNIASISRRKSSVKTQLYCSNNQNNDGGESPQKTSTIKILHRMKALKKKKSKWAQSKSINIHEVKKRERHSKNIEELKKKIDKIVNATVASEINNQDAVDEANSPNAEEASAMFKKLSNSIFEQEKQKILSPRSSSPNMQTNSSHQQRPTKKAGVLPTPNNILMYNNLQKQKQLEQMKDRHEKQLQYIKDEQDILNQEFMLKLEHKDNQLREYELKIGMLMESADELQSYRNRAGKAADIQQQLRTKIQLLLSENQELKQQKLSTQHVSLLKTSNTQLQKEAKQVQSLLKLYEMDREKNMHLQQKYHQLEAQYQQQKDVYVDQSEILYHKIDTYKKKIQELEEEKRELVVLCSTQDKYFDITKHDQYIKLQVAYDFLLTEKKKLMNDFTTITKEHQEVSLALEQVKHHSAELQKDFDDLLADFLSKD